MKFSSLLRSVPTAALLLAALAGPVLGQGQVVCFSIEGTNPASGSNNLGQASKLGVRVGGQNTFVSPPAGRTPTQVRDDLAAALAAKGFKTHKVGANVVCVDAGPGGAPLTSGGGIGDDDTGIEGIDVEVMKPPPVGAVKPAGGMVPGVKPGKAAQRPGVIKITIEVEVNGVRIKIPIEIQVQQGDSSQVIDQNLRQALRGAGFAVQDVQWRPVLGGTQAAPVQGFGIDRTVRGEPVHHIVYLPYIEPELRQLELSAGEFPLYGASEYGLGCGPSGTLPHLGAGSIAPRIGSPFYVAADALPPNAPGALLLGVGTADLPLDAFCPGGRLLVSPAGAVVVPIHTDGAGRMVFSLQIPYQPAWAGTRLYWQATVLAPQGGLALSNGLMTALGN
ncbi:MAG: hypothetical protein IT458_17040 [Planctomycetes bacterium]|nr:hypothetical protein [Planctomycetota bacterium]